MSNIDDENEENNFEEYEDDGEYEGDEEEYEDDEEYSDDDEYYEDEEDDSEEYDDEEEYDSEDEYEDDESDDDDESDYSDDEYGDDDDTQYEDVQDDDLEFEEQPIDEVSSETSQGQSPYLAGGAAPQQAKKKSSVGCLLIALLILSGIAGATYIKTGTFDVTLLFSGDGVNNAKTEKSKQIEDIAIQNEGDDFFAQATGIGAKDNEEVGDKQEEVQEPPKEEEQPVAEQKPLVKVEIPSVQKAPVPAQVLSNANGTKNVVFVRQGGRKDPFLPIGYRSRAEELLRAKASRASFDDDFFYEVPPSKNNGDYVVPATKSVYEKEYVENLMNITKFTVNGIMYDPAQPSAILRYNNVDYFVHKGDTFDMFTVADIKKNSVVIKSGTNSYTAVLGQTQTTGGYDDVEVSKKSNFNEVNKYVDTELMPVQGANSHPDLHVNPVSNLDKKFGGNYGARYGGN